MASLSARVKRAGKNSITMGSEFSAANDARSVGFLLSQEEALGFKLDQLNHLRRIRSEECNFELTPFPHQLVGTTDS